MSATQTLPAAQARVLFVHAHPDDESIMTGGTMAALAASGAHVALVTATRGEGGEVIGELQERLEGNRAELAAHREQELAQALEILGVNDHAFLADGERGGADERLPSRRFEDSGMAWGPDGHAVPPDDMVPEALCAAPVSEAAGYLVNVIRRVRPQLVITYSSGGGYGHPDHVRMHEATVAACRRVEGTADEVATLLFFDTPADAAADAFDPQAPGFDLTGFASAESIPTIAAEAPIAVAHDVDAVIGAKSLAMAAHRTQITVAGQFFALSNGIGQKVMDVECYTDAAYPGPEPAPYALVDNVLDAVTVPVETRAYPTPDGSGTDDATAATASAAHGAPGAASTAGTGAVTAAGAGSARAGTESPGRPKTGAAAIIHAILVGLLIGVLGSFQHLNATAWELGGQQIIAPWGLALALALSTAGMWHIAGLYRSTSLMVLCAAIICMVSFLFTQQGLLPGADLIVAAYLRSIVWLVAPMGIAAVLAFMLPSLKAPKRS
ncbi:PIG-L family deacetylase [Brevibacterium sp. p3-SID960]|uniref:PIG-L family deacetylase n=1 Tax=Brevibacterium sp. p3-SID960 TaxID=2916063 RepID=UPI0021A6050B|nr:PIG-L family deacetylase [Brevibacterium sp. p3-SID960]MCT1690564.1 PIG-L family deacetylase [Brevibacterium sp. p3-SID960]